MNCSSPVKSGLSTERGVYHGVVYSWDQEYDQPTIDVPAERHVRRNITLKPGNVSKNRDATGRQDFVQRRETCTCLVDNTPPWRHTPETTTYRKYPRR